MACRWQTLFQLRQRHMWYPIPKGLLLWYLQPTCWPMTPSIGTCYLLYYKTHLSLHLTHPYSLPFYPQVSFKHPLPCGCFSHHSPSPVLLGTGNTGLLDFVSRYYNYWPCLQLLFDSGCTLKAVSVRLCNPEQCLAIFWVSAHNSLWLKGVRESMFKWS